MELSQRGCSSAESSGELQAAGDNEDSHIAGNNANGDVEMAAPDHEEHHSCSDESTDSCPVPKGLPKSQRFDMQALFPP